MSTIKLYNHLKKFVPVKVKLKIKTLSLQVVSLITHNNDLKDFVEQREDLSDTEKFLQQKFATAVNNKWKSVIILSTPHTQWYAALISLELEKHNIITHVKSTYTGSQTADIWFVICPQVFKELPPLEKCIIFQMEQLNQDRWLTDSYVKILEDCAAIVEYSFVNLEVLEKINLKYQKIYLVPVGIQPLRRQSNSKESVVFYGDSSSPRRKRILENLSSKRKITILDGVFEEELSLKLAPAAVILNVHYYDNSLLETTRLNEALSYGIPIVSELSVDRSDYPEYEKVVMYFDSEDLKEFNSGVEHFLSMDAFTVQEEIQSTHDKIKTKFEFHFARFLLGMGVISLDQFRGFDFKIDFSTDLCLSLPETVDRYERAKDLPAQVFTGLRHYLGWIGCGLSYKNLAVQARNESVKQIVVYEDDVVLPNNYESIQKSIQGFLETLNGNWDIFSGMISNLDPETEILSVDTFEGLNFVTLNRMTSTVYNIFSERGIDLLCLWNENDFDLKHNTIDQYFGHCSELRVITVFPFLFGHDSFESSTLWGFNNDEYVDSITKSSQLLKQKIENFQKSRNSF